MAACAATERGRKVSLLRDAIRGNGSYEGLKRAAILTSARRAAVLRDAFAGGPAAPRGRSGPPDARKGATSMRTRGGHEHDHERQQQRVERLGPERGQRDTRGRRRTWRDHEAHDAAAGYRTSDGACAGRPSRGAAAARRSLSRSASAKAATSSRTAPAGRRPRRPRARAGCRRSRRRRPPSAAAAACSGVAMPKPSATGTVGARLRARDDRRERVRQRRALARRAGHRDGVEEAARALADRAPGARRCRRRDQRHEREPGGVAGGAQRRRPPRAAGRGRSGRSRRRSAASARSARRRARGRGSRSSSARPGAARRAPRDRRARRRPSRRRAAPRVPAAWITGPSASGSENGTPSSTRSAPPSA